MVRMKYKLARQVLSDQVVKTITRNLRAKKEKILRATTKQMKELAAVSRIIEKEGIPKYLVCKKLSGKLGFGLFLHPCAKPLVKGQVIASYSGEIVIAPQNVEDDCAYAFESLSDMKLTKEEQVIYNKKGKYHPGRLYALYIDAVKKGNFTRFINHSDKPNIEPEILTIPKNPYGLTPTPLEVVYIVKRTINPGEQLVVSYDGDDGSYWGVMNIKPFPMTSKTFRLDPSLNLIRS